MNKKNILIMVVGGLVVLGLVFYGGMKFGGRNQVAANNKGSFSGQFNPQATGIQRSGGQVGGISTKTGMNGELGGGVSGEVIAKDDTSITVKSKDGSSKIVFCSEKTLVSKTAITSLSDVVVGGQVVIIGSADASGIISAESIQLR